MLMLAVQPPWRAPHRRRVCDGGLRAARAHRQGAAERAPECGAAEQRQAAQGCDGPGACPTRRSPVHAGACKALTTAHGHVSASQVLTTAPDLRPPRRSRRMRSSSLRTRRPCATCSRPSSTRCDLVPVPRHACAAHASAHHGAPCPLSPQVISYRYRDTHEDIRAACIASLGRGLRVLPSFCDDKHLKYMGWQLSDIQSAAVRLACTVQASARMQVLTTAPPLPAAPRRCASRRCRRSRTCTRPLTRSRI